MKRYSCGLCKQEDRSNMNRWSLRKHLREDHRILREITNTKAIKGSTKQLMRNWWITEEWK